MFSVRHIEAFQAVMVTRSMTSAADVLFVTQSAVSKLIKEFEEQVGFELFTRKRGGLVPSPEAHSLLAEVDRLFLGLEKIALAAERIRSKRHGQLRIVAMPSLTTGFLQGVVAAFSREHPDVSVSLLTYNSPEVVELVASGQFDLGYAMTPISRDRGLVAHVSLVDCVCILPPRHPKRRRRELDPGDLAGEPFVSLAADNPTRMKVDALFKNENIHRHLAFEAGWSAAVVGFVAQGMGASILDPFSTDMALALGCSVHRMTQPIPFSFAEIKASSTTRNDLADLFSAQLEERLRGLHGYARPRRAAS
ncbi:LysR substrate-binding domain-containing protein [Pigmentiphaga sp. GD03639]|uniref:LysR substrate-binding domain-containing protein n=1 Tax=Pigmentiphaga sp. GD03639 TaxID=2975354 RepID=UPI00244A2D88|nr:LysR substrate-binding domain-containing protein [Pigmentiphaga sp. GD03639]MDH2236200.1 LysR substrate-binding domain-containing protein [Pigmentiphaga sp. GD03639]